MSKKHPQCNFQSPLLTPSSLYSHTINFLHFPPITPELPDYDTIVATLETIEPYTDPDTNNPTGPLLTQDDRLLSAAYIALVDERHRASHILLGHAHSAIIPAPLTNMEY